jgi:hypothetical protein
MHYSELLGIALLVLVGIVGWAIIESVLWVISHLRWEW